MVCASLATPGTEACDAVGGAFRPQWTEWPSSEYWTSSVVRAEVALRMPLSALCVRYVYSFLGPLAGSALGGDFNLTFTFLDIAPLGSIATPAPAWASRYHGKFGRIYRNRESADRARWRGGGPRFGALRRHTS